MLPKKLDTVMVNINALKLAPGEVLLVQASKLSPDQKRQLSQDLTKQLWGKPNTFVLLTGDIQMQKTTARDPLSLAGLMAKQLEADPLMADKIKEHLPPRELVRLLGLESYVAEQAAGAAIKADPNPDDPELYPMGHSKNPILPRE